MRAPVDARVKFNAGVLQVDRLSVADLGGAKLDISGHIDELSSKPRGRLNLNLDAGALSGLVKLVGRFAPQTAVASYQRVANRLAPAKLHGTLTVDHGADAGAVAKLDLDGQAGALHLSLNGEAKGEPDRLGEAVVRLDSRLDGIDGTALTRLLGLDGALAVDQLPGQMTISASGPLERRSARQGARHRRRLRRRGRGRAASDRRHGADGDVRREGVRGRFAAAASGHDRSARHCGADHGEREIGRGRERLVVRRFGGVRRQGVAARPARARSRDPDRDQRSPCGRRCRRRRPRGGAARPAGRRRRVPPTPAPPTFGRPSRSAPARSAPSMAPLRSHSIAPPSRPDRWCAISRVSRGSSHHRSCSTISAAASPAGALPAR